MADEKQDVVIDKAAVAAAMLAIEAAGEYASVTRIMRKLKEMFGRSGNRNQVHDLQRQIKTERAANSSEQVPPVAVDPLPEEYVELIREANEAFTGLMGAFGNKLAQGHSIIKSELHRSADTQIAEAKAQSQRAVEEMAVEAREALADADRLEHELEEKDKRVAELNAALSAAREQLAAANERATQAAADRDTTKVELTAAREKAEASARERGELLADKAKLAEQLRVAQERGDRLAQENEQLAANNASLTASLDSSRSGIAAEKARSEQFASDRDAAKREAMAERERADKAVAAETDAHSSAARLDEQLKAANAELVVLRAKLKGAVTEQIPPMEMPGTKGAKGEKRSEKTPSA